jgi:signal transduction histidine kinase
MCGSVKEEKGNGDLADNNVKWFTAMPEQRHMTLTHNIQTHTLMFADQGMIDTIVRNLLSNALKFAALDG